VYLDVRASNLRCTGGAVRGLLDWSNALVGDPAMELGRLAEYALPPQNGLDYDAVPASYQEPIPVGDLRGGSERDRDVRRRGRRGRGATTQWRGSHLPENHDAVSAGPAAAWTGTLPT
jgi:aminoglycoside phosphotransferase (APT) family kinase protein